MKGSIYPGVHREARGVVGTMANWMARDRLNWVAPPQI